MEDLLKDTKLRFSTDRKPGFSRKVKGKKFTYFDQDEREIRDKETIGRINKLAIPPAYERVWICPSSFGHLQATGYDARHRKQYKYHPLWIVASQEEKFGHLIEFAKTLPKIRRRIKKDLGYSGVPRQKVMAVVVWLLENTLIRIGNEEYEKENKSYGLTTLKKRHVNIYASNIRFQFRGKSGVYHNLSTKNKKVARIVRRCKELPGQDLFEYLDEQKVVQTISSENVNEYLKEITRKDITAKDFRTWGGTVLAAFELDNDGVCENEDLSKRNIIETVKKVAQHLGNKPNTCRKYYIHPNVITAYTKGFILSNYKEAWDEPSYSGGSGLYEHENKVVAMIKHMDRKVRSVSSG